MAVASIPSISMTLPSAMSCAQRLARLASHTFFTSGLSPCLVLPGLWMPSWTMVIYIAITIVNGSMPIVHAQFMVDILIYMYIYIYIYVCIYIYLYIYTYLWSSNWPHQKFIFHNPTWNVILGKFLKPVRTGLAPWLRKPPNMVLSETETRPIKPPFHPSACHGN